MKKKMYGNAMRGKVESTNLEEALVKVTDVEFNYRDQLPNSPKTSDLGAISGEWKQDRIALRDAVKKMGGLVTNTVAPSRGNKWVGTVTIGTRGDASKLDDKSIQKAVKRHGIEIHSNQFKESTNLEEKYAVKYTHPTDKKSGKTTGPMSKAAADKKAAMGNRVDRVGGKYTVIPHVEAAGQEYTAVPIKTGDVSQADRLTIAKMDAIMKKRSKDKRQKESVNLEENKIFFVKVGDGRDSMTVKTKARNSREALKKMRSEHPKSRVSLDINQKQGQPAGALESVEMNESSLPPHLQKIIGKNGQIDKKKVDQHVHGKKTKVTDVTPKGYGPKEDVDEATMADRTVLRAVRVAKDMAGNHTGASKRIEKMKKGLSDHPKVKDALRLANESVSSADKKPQNFRDPETGKLKVRMVPVDRDVVRGNDAAKSVARKKRFKHMRKEQMATGNSQVGKSGRDAFMNAFKDIQKTAAEIQKKKDADRK
jgi:hypothetical protein